MDWEKHAVAYRRLLVPVYVLGSCGQDVRAPSFTPHSVAAAWPPGQSSRFDGWRRCRLRCLRESIREKESDRATGDRPGTSRCRQTQAVDRQRRAGKCAKAVEK